MVEVRRRGVAVPAVALTAFARAEDGVKAMAAGFQAHVSKPADGETLLAVLGGLLDGKRTAPPR
jgi:CheY-like chemotaxis protein